MSGSGSGHRAANTESPAEGVRGEQRAAVGRFTPSLVTWGCVSLPGGFFLPVTHGRSAPRAGTQPAARRRHLGTAATTTLALPRRLRPRTIFRDRLEVPGKLPNFGASSARRQRHGVSNLPEFQRGWDLGTAIPGIARCVCRGRGGPAVAGRAVPGPASRV